MYLKCARTARDFKDEYQRGVIVNRKGKESLMYISNTIRDKNYSSNGERGDIFS